MRMYRWKVHPSLEEEELRRILAEAFQREEGFDLTYGTCGGDWGSALRERSFFDEKGFSSKEAT
jgi:hypothetical protein